MNRLTFFAAGAATLVSTAALAADLSLATPVSAYNWSGFYAGVHGGFGGDKFTYPFSINLDGAPPMSVGGNLSLNSSGFYGGGQVGYNWQFAPQWVGGLEADINASAIEGKLGLDLNATDGTDSVHINGSAGSKLDYFGTVRARVGWANGPLLLYGTGGFAYGDVTSSISGSASGAISGSLDGISKTNHHTGWTIGGGVEYALTRNVSLKTEYKWVDLGTQDLFSLSDGADSLKLSETTKFHTLEVGLNYRF